MSEDALYLIEEQLAGMLQTVRVILVSLYEFGSSHQSDAYDVLEQAMHSAAKRHQKLAVFKGAAV